MAWSWAAFAAASFVRSSLKSGSAQIGDARRDLNRGALRAGEMVLLAIAVRLSGTATGDEKARLGDMMTEDWLQGVWMKGYRGCCGKVRVTSMSKQCCDSDLWAWWSTSIVEAVVLNVSYRDRERRSSTLMAVMNVKQEEC